jgi:hypothetical protein
MGFSDSFKLGLYMNKRKQNCQLYDDEAISIFNSYIKENYYMIGNAVCPPVIAVLAGSILNCILLNEEDNNEDNESSWLEKGLFCGIELAFDALSPTGKADFLKGK